MNSGSQLSRMLYQSYLVSGSQLSRLLSSDAGTLGWSDPVSHDCGSFVECGPTIMPHSPAKSIFRLHVISSVHTHMASQYERQISKWGKTANCLYFLPKKTDLKSLPKRMNTWPKRTWWRWRVMWKAKSYFQRNKGRVATTEFSNWIGQFPQMPLQGRYSGLLTGEWT